MKTQDEIVRFVRNIGLGKTAEVQDYAYLLLIKAAGFDIVS
jgi:hypothetical protein